jgi:hypothetical protein
MDFDAMYNAIIPSLAIGRIGISEEKKALGKQ